MAEPIVCIGFSFSSVAGDKAAMLCPSTWARRKLDIRLPGDSSPSSSFIAETATDASDAFVRGAFLGPFCVPFFTLTGRSISSGSIVIGLFGEGIGSGEGAGTGAGLGVGEGALLNDACGNAKSCSEHS